MKRISKKKISALVFALLLVWGAFFGALFLRHDEPLLYYDTMVEAAQRMDAAMAEIRTEKMRRGIDMEKNDIWETGLIGPENSAIVTTLGALEAKRTAADPDMAALCVRIYMEAGLKRGDTVGICMSGSFPGLVLASLTAADAMGLNTRYICSVGASTYGATNEEFTLPEMIEHLYCSGLISTPPLAVTWGGEGDSGKNMIGRLIGETEPFVPIEARIAALGYTLPEEMDYVEDALWRQDMYGDIDCFVSVGGHLVATGRDGQAYSLGEGLISPQHIRITDRSGLVERYLASGIPTVSLVNVKKLCLAYGMSFDGTEREEIGTSSVYFHKSVFKTTER